MTLVLVDCSHNVMSVLCFPDESELFLFPLHPVCSGRHLVLFSGCVRCGPVRSGPGVFDLSVSLTPSLVVLVALNMLLFYKLYALERAAHTLERWHSYSVADR